MIISRTVTIKFKYNTCYYSTIYRSLPRCNLLKFKYNTCYYSTNLLKTILIPQPIFKYNTCYYSTLQKTFTKLEHIYSNTTPVTIQLTKKLDAAKTGLFKYNTCYYSTLLVFVVLDCSF